MYGDTFKTGQHEGICYEIVVKGHLDPQRSHWFEGMSITLLPEGQTQLSGALPDQAALHSVLTRIRDLGLTLISVQRRSEEQALNEERASSDAALRRCGPEEQASSDAALRRCGPEEQASSDAAL